LLPWWRGTFSSRREAANPCRVVCQTPLGPNLPAPRRRTGDTCTPLPIRPCGRRPARAASTATPCTLWGNHCCNHSHCHPHQLAHVQHVHGADIETHGFTAASAEGQGRSSPGATRPAPSRPIAQHVASDDRIDTLARLTFTSRDHEADRRIIVGRHQHGPGSISSQPTRPPTTSLSSY